MYTIDLLSIAKISKVLKKNKKNIGKILLYNNIKIRNKKEEHVNQTQNKRNQNTNKYPNVA